MPNTIETLGASHLVTENYEVQRTNNFEIQIEGLGEDNKRTLIFAVVSGFLPNESNEVISLNYGNTTVSVAGKANVNGSGSLVVRDLIKTGVVNDNNSVSSVERMVDKWRKNVYDKKTDAIGLVANYKKPAYVTQYAPDGTHLRVWKLEGVWPSAVDYGTVSYDSPGAKTINITLQYDKAHLENSTYYES